MIFAQRNVVYFDCSRLDWDRFALACQLIGPFPLNMNGRKLRRHLFDLPYELRQQLFDLFTRDWFGVGNVNHFTGDVVGVTLFAE